MKIDRSRLKKSTSEMPAECQVLIDKLRSSSLPLEELKEIDTWTFGKCELYHWIDVLDIFDKILEEAAKPIAPNNWILTCDLPENSEEKELLLWVLHFTTLLVEHSFSRHLYNSVEHLIALLASCDMSIVLGVLNLLYMFSKRSNFITRLNSEKRQALIRRLTHLAESWGGLESGYSMADCCRNFPPAEYPPNSSVLHYEFYAEMPESNQTGSGKGRSYSNMLTVMHIENLDKLNKTPAEIMNDIVERYPVPKEKQMCLFTHIRLTVNFTNYPIRLLCVQARLQALSVLAYSNALLDNAHTLLYNGLLEELVDVVERQDPNLVEIRAAALRTLTSIIQLDRNPHFPNRKPGSRLNTIVEVTGAASYHGILPTMVRSCINALVAADQNHRICPFPLPLATALFSFLYHLASYEAGGEALVSCGMMESLLRVINWPGTELEHITFVTRAVRVIDLITNIEMQGFMTNGGLASFISRLEMEVNICRKEQPFEIPVPEMTSAETQTEPSHGSYSTLETDMHVSNTDMLPSPLETHYSDNTSSVMDMEGGQAHQNMESCYDPTPLNVGASTSRGFGTSSGSRKLPDYSAAKSGKTCLPQRAALLKSMLNFLKKAIQDTSFADNIRHIMDGSLPNSLKHIISNAEYYGPSLFLLATDVVTVYVFQEPSLLSSLQDNGLTQVVLHALLVKDVPATREVLGSLPNVFSALCLNSRGLSSFVLCDPFERLFKVLLSPVYLGAMRRRRSSDPIGDTASNLGNAMDELMRHQPTLKADVTIAIIQLLEELCVLGRDPKYVCWRAQSKLDVSPTPVSRPSGNNEGGSSDEDDDDEEEASTSSHPHRDDTGDNSNLNERTPIALIDYITNVMKFVDAILSNNSTDDHCREFVAQNGLHPLMSILGLPNLPVDYPATTAAQHVATVCKSILNLSHEPQVLKIGLMQLSVILDSLAPLHCPIGGAGSSVLLHEIAMAPNLDTAFNTASATPLLHAMSAAHGYVIMFVHVCRTGQSDIRSLSVIHWASELGLNVLQGLAKLYTSLVWESTLLLGICSEDIIPPDSKFGKEDLERLQPLDLRGDGSPWNNSSNDTASNGMTSAMEALSTNDMEVIVERSGEKMKSGRTLPTALQLKYIKPLLGASSRLGRALAELFGLLVKLCVGSPTRQRRGQQVTSISSVPTLPARAVAGGLTELLVQGMSWTALPKTPIYKFKLTFLICSVGFTSPMLFDEKKYPYYLMLQKFTQHHGHVEFFESFQWAITAGNQFPLSIGIEHPDLPEGTGEFLDAWLMLLEKMVNPKPILDSPHNFLLKQGITYQAFDPLKYLLEMQKCAFDAILLLWDKKPLPEYGPRMAELMLAILKHILRGEKLMLEHVSKGKEVTHSDTFSLGSSRIANVDASGNIRTTRRRGSDNPEVNLDNLRKLMDMGFSRERCIEALLYSSDMEQATEYLLLTPPTHSRGVQDYSTIGVSKEILDSFTNRALGACLRLIDTLPDTVYRVCDLLVAISKRNGHRWRYDMLEKIMIDIDFKLDYLLTLVRGVHDDDDLEYACREVTSSETASELATRIHLFTLLFEGPVYQEMHVPCAKIVENAELLKTVVTGLHEIILVLADNGGFVTPKWFAPLLLLIDLVQKFAYASRRKDASLKITNNVWRWYDLTTGRWTPYSVANNKIINDAYWNGENAVWLNCGRRRYIIHFNCMIQANEESGGRRPVTMSLKVREKTEGKDFPPKSDKKDKEGGAEEEDDIGGVDPIYRRHPHTVMLNQEQEKSLIRSCLNLLALSVDRDTLHAAMRILLRLTRYYENTRVFIQEGGVLLLLNLTQSSTFNGFLSLSTLLIRHAIEEPKTLRQTMEKVLRTRTVSNIPPPYKEILYLLRNTSSLLCRDPSMFLNIARETFRVDLSLVLKRNEEDDHRLIVKMLPCHTMSSIVMKEKGSAQVITHLLDALIRPGPRGEMILNYSREQEGWEKEKPRKSTSTGQSFSITQNPLQLVGHSASVPNSSHSSDPLRQDVDENYRGPISDCYRRNKEEHGNAMPTEEEVKRIPLLSKSAILKILAEAVRSYTPCARLITGYSYVAGQSKLVTEDCSALAFLLDKILPAGDNIYERDAQNMLRMLIAALASCNHSSDVQMELVDEVKAALLRSLAMPESAEKHAHIQHLASLISLMIDNCLPSVNLSPSPIKVHHQYGHCMNNIVKIMIRKGVITDLARVSHYLDLSSPHIANSINATLKPLETLSRIINQPSATGPSKSVKQKTHGIVGEGITNQTGTTTSGATHAQGDEMVEDGENTEHDISGGAEMLDRSPDIQGQEGVDYIIENDVTGLEDVMDQLLDREVVGSGDENILSGDYGIEQESETGMETDDILTPPVRNQDGLRFGNEDDLQDGDQGQSSDSDSGSNGSDDPDEEVNNVEDEDDEEDEEADNEDEEEGGSGYDEDGVEFLESDEFRMPALDRENEDVFMIRYPDPDPSGSGSYIPWNGNSFPLPFGTFEDPSNGNDIPTLNPIPSNHPLLVARHHNTETATVATPRAPRGNRQRRYQYLQISSRNPNPPVILQSPFRLLGPPNLAQEVPATQPIRDATRVVVMDNGTGLFAEEDQIDYMDQSGYLFGASLSATLNNIPTAMFWWCEEAKLLDGDSQHDVCIAAAHLIVQWLENQKAEELAERREKMRRKQEEEERKRRKEEREKLRTTEGDAEVAGTSASCGTNTSSPSEVAATADVASATDNLPETLVLHPPHPPSQASSGSSEFSEVTSGLLNTLSEIIPPINEPVDSFERYPENGTVHSETFASCSADHSLRGSMMIHSLEDLGSSRGTTSSGSEPTVYSSPSESVFDSDLTVTPSASGLDLTLIPNIPNSELHLTSVSGCVTDSPVNPTLPNSVACLPHATDRHNLETQEEECASPDLHDESVPPPLIPLEDVLLPSQSLRNSSSFPPQTERPESHTASRVLPSPGTPTSHTPEPSRGCAPDLYQEVLEYAAATGRRIMTDPQDIFEYAEETTRRIMGDPEEILEYTPENAPRVMDDDQEEVMELSETTRLISDPQEALNCTDLRDPVTGELIDPRVIERSVSWFVRNSPQQNTDDQASSEGFDRSPEQQEPANSSTDSTSEIPEGVDPSFLAALPAEMREEVIAEQFRLQRLRQRALQQSTDASPANITEVNPEFLAALPPSIQEEVLAQQRLEQQRQAAAATNPNDPVDAAAFFQNLQPSLRQAILTDMEDSQISVLPPELAEEAQNLRREWEARNRQLMQERFFSHVSHNGSALSSILRNSGRVSSGRYGIHSTPQRAQWSPWNSNRHDQNSSLSHLPPNAMRLRGRQLLDHEALTCILVMLFVDEPKLNTGRLHRVLRNLCYHAPTREWLIKTLLSIMERCNCRPENTSTPKPRRMSTRSQVHQSQQAHIATSTAPSWLNLTMDAALGLQASVFNIVRHSGKRGSRSQETASITLHAQAAPIVFRHTLELMISLAKSFPGHFLPVKNIAKEHYGVKTRASTSSNNPGSRNSRYDQTNFWEILLKLDALNTSRKGKSMARSATNAEEESRAIFESSAFGQLVAMLASPIVKRSCMLTDKLLRLLSLISIGLPEMNPYVQTAGSRRSTGREESVPITEHHLKLAINVLTSKSCSEEGLEDATALLLNLSHCPDPTKDVILRLLLQGAMELANMVNSCINALMKELRAMNQELHKEETEELGVTDRLKKGTLPDRFTNETVVVTAPVKIKGACDLQLPSMTTLTTKTSSQAFFLRILKVIVQIRESVRMSHSRQRENSESLNYFHGDSSTEEQVSGPDESTSNAAMDTTAATNMLHSHAHSQGQSQSNDEEAVDPLDTRHNRPTKEEEEPTLPTLSEQLPLDNLWETLSTCLLELADTPDHHAVLVLQPAVEAFFLVHSTAAEEQRISMENHDIRNLTDPLAQTGETAPPRSSGVQSNVAPVSPLQSDTEAVSAAQPNSTYLNFSWEPSPSPVTLPPDQQKFLKFAETHRTVLNQILRQSNTHLADGPFAVLVDHTRVLDFDVKRRYFRSELDRMDEGIRREELAVHVRRSHVFEDSFRELHRRGADEWKNRFYIVFEGEEGQDAGGLLREWYVIISREIFNPMYALFRTSPGDRVTYMINSSSHCNPNHLCYFKFVGRVIAKAIYDNKLLECYFTRSFYKHILGILVKYTDMESEDYSFYQGLIYLMENNVSDLGYDLTFSAEVQEFGVTDVRDLIPNGRNIAVTEQTKMDYVRLVCQMKMTGAIRKQIDAFLEGFYDIIPKRLISIFNEQELELLISGMPNVDIEDLKANTEYHKYQPTSLQIQWFWRALRAFEQADRAKFLQFVTGTSKVPLQGFAALEGMNGVQKFQIHRDDRSTDRLPSAHTCFNQLDLPVYETYDKLRTYLLKAIHECSEGFGFA